jgi:hypothetical protein
MPAKPPKQVQRVYDVFLQLYSEFQPEGVYYGTWLKSCGADGISESTFKHARGELLNRFKLVHQPDTTGAYFPTETGGQAGPTRPTSLEGLAPLSSANGQAGPMGQNGDNCPDVGPCPEQSPGQGQWDNFSREIVPLSLPRRARLARVSTTGTTQAGPCASSAAHRSCLIPTAAGTCSPVTVPRR